MRGQNCNYHIQMVHDRPKSKINILDIKGRAALWEGQRAGEIDYALHASSMIVLEAK